MAFTNTGTKPATSGTVSFATHIIGALGIAYGGFTYTYKDKVVDAGPIQITTDKHKTLPVPPIAGALIMVAGVALVMKPARS